VHCRGIASSSEMPVPLTLSVVALSSTHLHNLESDAPPGDFATYAR